MIIKIKINVKRIVELISINLCEDWNFIKLRPKRIQISGKKWRSYKIIKIATRAYYLNDFFLFWIGYIPNILKTENSKINTFVIWYGALRYTCKFIYLKTFHNLLLVCLSYNFNFHKNASYHSSNGFTYKYFGKIAKLNI